MAIAPTHVSHGRPVVRAVVVVAVLVAAVFLLAVAEDVFSGSSGSTVVQGSGVAAAQTRHVPPFERVQLAGSNNVVVRVGGEQSVVVHADDNLVSRVTTRVDGGNLVIGNVDGSFSTKTPMRVEVTVPRLDELTLSGSGTMVASGIASKTFTATVSGSGVINASGSTHVLDASVDGSGDALLEELVAEDVRAVVSGSGQVLVTARHSLDASVPGSGAVFYRGNPPHVKTAVTGSGAVTPG